MQLPTSRARRLLAAGTGAAVLIALIGVSAPAQALAPVPNAAGAFAVSVPSSLLSAAAPDAAAAAALANSVKYDWSFSDPAYAEISGSQTAAPLSEYSVSLTTAERATFDAAVADFAAPAVSATALEVGGVAAGGFLLGLQIGSGAARVVGFKDNQVCEQNSAALDVLGSIFDGVNCDAYQNALTAVQRDADQYPVSTFPTTTVDGVTASYQAGIPWPTLPKSVDLLTCFNWTGTRPTGDPRIWLTVYGSDNTINFTGSYEANSYCGPDSNLSGWWIEAPLLSYQLHVGDDSSAVITTTSITTPDPDRYWQCTIHTTAGHTYTANSATFTEEASTLAGVVCPSVPAGEVIDNETVTEVGGGYGDRVAMNEPSTAAYQSWATNFSECSNGSCLLDLRQDNQSCFLTIDPSACSGWIDNSEGYTCYEGTQEVALAECNVYAQVFDPINWPSGHAYADPATGSVTEAKTSPSDIDQVESALLTRSWVTTADYPLVDDSSKPALAAAIAAACVSQLEPEPDILIIKTCSKTAIYSPGVDVAEATAHDLSAIGAGQPPLLHYETSTQKGIGGVSPGWYGTPATNCSGTYRPSTDDFPTNCDEFPFYSTVEGGPGASLRNILGTDNQKQGRQLGQFYQACGLVGSPTASDSNYFVVVPNPGSPSVGICGLE